MLGLFLKWHFAPPYFCETFPAWGKVVRDSDKYLADVRFDLWGFFTGAGR